MTSATPDEGPIEIKSDRPWLDLFDNVLVPQARRDYGFVPDHWKDLRTRLEAVDAGDARMVLHMGSPGFLRGGDLALDSVLQLLLVRLKDADVPLYPSPEPRA